MQKCLGPDSVGGEISITSGLYLANLTGALDYWLLAEATNRYQVLLDYLSLYSICGLVVPILKCSSTTTKMILYLLFLHSCRWRHLVLMGPKGPFPARFGDRINSNTSDHKYRCDTNTGTSTDKCEPSTTTASYC